MRAKVMYYLAYFMCSKRNCKEEIEGVGHTSAEAAADLRTLYAEHLVKHHGLGEWSARLIAGLVRPTSTDEVTEPGPYPKEQRHGQPQDV